MLSFFSLPFFFPLPKLPGGPGSGGSGHMIFPNFGLLVRKMAANLEGNFLD